MQNKPMSSRLEQI